MDIFGKMREALKEHNRAKIVIFLLLLFFCVIQLYHIMFALREYKYETQLYRTHGGNYSRHAHEVVYASQIDWWMTFSYINFVFELPPSYLQRKLGLRGEEYPGIQIRRYARIYNLDSNELVEQIRTAVEEYQK